MEQYDPTTPTSSSEDEMTNTKEPKEKNKDKPKENKEENKVRENTTSEKAHKHVRDNPPAPQSKYIQNESDKHHSPSISENKSQVGDSTNVWMCSVGLLSKNQKSKVPGAVVPN